MMRKVTDAEVTAIFNELESDRIRIDKTQLPWNSSRELERWIDGKLLFKDLPYSAKSIAIDLLFESKEKSGITQEKERFVHDVLMATEDEKLVEVANKLYQFVFRTPSSLRRDREIALLILEEQSLRDKAPKVTETIRIDRKVLTLGKEIVNIRKRYKKSSKKEAKARYKHSNICDISVEQIYAAVIKYFDEHVSGYYGESYKQKMERYKRDLRNIVLRENYRITNMLKDLPTLEFIKSQEVTKIR